MGGIEGHKNQVPLYSNAQTNSFQESSGWFQIPHNVDSSFLIRSIVSKDIYRYEIIEVTYAFVRKALLQKNIQGVSMS